jgi:hypothetical protein
MHVQLKRITFNLCYADCQLEYSTQPPRTRRVVVGQSATHANITYLCPDIMHLHSFWPHFGAGPFRMRTPACLTVSRAASGHARGARSR